MIALGMVFGSLALTACGTTPIESLLTDGDRSVPVTKAQLPSVLQRYERIDAVLSCIRSTGALTGRTFVVGPFADSTGKINAVAQGATGNFMPQGGSAAYITDAISRSGGRVISTYFGTPTVKAPAQYMINGIFNSLDFGAPVSVDMRVAGIGPTVQTGWAQLSLSMQLDEAGTRINRQISMIQRPVRYYQVGAGVGAVIHNTLVTGGMSGQDQERLQLEALNGPIALGVADVIMKEFPKARQACHSTIADLLASRQDLEASANAAPAKPPKSVDSTHALNRPAQDSPSNLVDSEDENAYSQAAAASANQNSDAGENAETETSTVVANPKSQKSQGLFQWLLNGT